MNRNIQQHMYNIVDAYIYPRDVKRLFKSIILRKENGANAWSEITINTHLMLGGSSPDIERFAAVTELVALIIDVIDGFYDQDQEIKPWPQYSKAEVLNAIIALLMGVVGELGQLQVAGSRLNEIAKIVTRRINGHYKEMMHTVGTVDGYLQITQEKCGSLFRLACFMGYMSVKCPRETTMQLDDLADCIGLIHQIQNDMSGIVRYDVKNDLYNKKRTLPIMYLLSVEDQAFRLLKDYYEGLITSDFVLQRKETFIQMIEESGCMEYARVVQVVCLQKAEEIYECLQAVSPYKIRFKEATYGSFLSEEKVQ